MDKKNNNVIACIHADLTGDTKDKEQGVAIKVEGNPLTLGALYRELTERLLKIGVPKEFIEIAYKGAVQEVCGNKSAMDHAKDTLSALAKMFE